jgi:hypothetical protein
MVAAKTPKPPMMPSITLTPGVRRGSGVHIFFDRPEVTKAIGKARAATLRQSGGYIRKTARSLIKKVGKARKPPKQFTRTRRVSKAWQRWTEEFEHRPASPPGTPPYTHTSGNYGLRSSILFAYERSTQGVVVGPAASIADQIGQTHEKGGLEFDNAPNRNRRRPNWKLEVGGHGPILLDHTTGNAIYAKLHTPAQVTRSKWLARIIDKDSFKPRAANRARKYPPRPFMAPAFAAAVPRLASFWKNSIRAR